MFDDDPPPRRRDAPQPRKLDLLGVGELKEYIAWLEEEKARALAEIARKESAGTKASSLFKT